MDFKPRHVKRIDGLPYAVIRKTKPKGRKEIHIKISDREKQMMIAMRKHHHSMNGIARHFGRSTSIVWKVLNTAKSYVIGKSRQGYLKFAFPELHSDNRKLPNRTRRLMVGVRRGILERLRRGIEAYILGELDEPP